MPRQRERARPAQLTWPTLLGKWLAQEDEDKVAILHVDHLDGTRSIGPVSQYGKQFVVMDVKTGGTVLKDVIVPFSGVKRLWVTWEVKW